MKKNYLLMYELVKGLMKRAKANTLKVAGIILLAFCFVFAGYSQSRQMKSNLGAKLTPWAAKGLTNELLSQRSRTAKQFKVNDNKIALFTAPGSIHYLSDQNNWEDIETKIESNQGAHATTHPFAATKNSIKTWFPSNPFNSYILLGAKEGNFKERIIAINLLDANKNIIQQLNLSGSISASVCDNKITYTGFYPGLSLEYSLGNDNRKFDLIIQSPSFVSGLPAGVTYISIEEEFLSENQNIKFSISDNEVTSSLNGSAILKFTQPKAFDSNVNEDGNVEAELNFTFISTGILLQTDFATSWIRSSARVFPLHLDPTVDYYPQFTTFWTGYQTSSTGKSSGQLRIATSTTAAWAKFDLSTLPPGCTVTQAIYFGYHYSTTSTNKTCEIRTMGSVDPIPASATTIYNQITNGAAYNSGFTWGGSSYQWRSGGLTGTALTDIAAAAGSTFAIGVKYSSGSTTFMYHYGVNGNSSNICYLEVDYFTVPCSGTPGPNSVVTPSNAICPGSATNLMLANTYSVGGISYQWQSSSTSSVGPFTAITGATNAAITSPTLGTQTWFNVVITCSAGGSPLTATVGEVMVQQTTTNSIPYSEGFENISGENELPNCSWSIPNLGTTALTYTSSNTLGRIPRTGNNFASFYYNPGGINYFYTNGLQLEAGVTYSASLWYQTEYYGYNNWTDLSILIGTNQTSTGLNTIVSTNGSAISSVYKSLSDTFSVPSSGIYYLCVRGTGNTSSSAQFLSWDDLAVTIPCELNSPTVSLSASSTTICAGESVNLTASGADTYSWSSGASSNSINENPEVTTNYVVIATNTLSGCSVSLSEIIYVNPSPLVFAYSDNTTICSGSVAYLTAIGGSNNSYIWSTGGSGANITVSPTVASSYSVIATNPEGCSSQASIQIGINNLPTITVSSPQIDGICEGESAVLDASGAFTYSWVTSTPSQMYAGTSITVSPMATSIYTVTGVDLNGCENITTVSLLVSECTGLLNNTAVSNSYRIFPNPTNGEFSVEFSNASNREYHITDLTGRLILNHSSNEIKINFNLNGFADGIYYLTVSNNDLNEVIKIIKTH